MISLFRLAIVTALTLSVALALFVGSRVLFPAQLSDPSHLAAKRDYLAGVAANSGVSGSQPNLVVVLFDDLGYGDLGAYGSQAIRTPNIDRLAAGGLRFSSAYSPSPYCSA